MRLALTPALLALSLISFVFAHPVKVEPEVHTLELLAERDVNHVQWLERRMTPEEEAAALERKRQKDREYWNKKADAHRALGEAAKAGDPQAQAAFAAADEARKARSRESSQKYREKQRAAQALVALSSTPGSVPGGSGSSRPQQTTGNRSSQSGSSRSQAIGDRPSQSDRSGYQVGNALPSIQELRLPTSRPPPQSQPYPPLPGPPLTDVLRQGRSQSGQVSQGRPPAAAYGGQPNPYQGAPSSQRPGGGVPQNPYGYPGQSGRWPGQ